MRHQLAALLSIVAFSHGVGAASSCTLTDEDFATKMRSLASWQAIGDFHHQHFPGCSDDGLYAEGYSDLVVRALAAQWARLPELSRAASARPEFLAFVLKHVDASADLADLRAVKQHSETRCPEGHAELCNSIRAAVEAAIAEAR